MPPHSEKYKVPDAFDLGVERSLELYGVTVKHHDANIAHLQEQLILCYDQLSQVYNKFWAADSWLKGADYRVNTDLVEERRVRWLRKVRTVRTQTVNMMANIFQAGAEPVPPDDALDRDIASALDTKILLRNAAISSVGGLALVEQLRAAAYASVHEALVKAHNSIPFWEEQNVGAQFEEEYENNIIQFAEEEEIAAQAQKEAAEAQKLAEKEAEKDAAEAQKLAKKEAAEAQKLAKKEAAEDAREPHDYGQGPSAAAGRRRKEAEQQRKVDEQKRSLALEKVKAWRDRRQKSPPPRG